MAFTDELEQVRQLLREHPPADRGHSARDAGMAILQAAADQLPDTLFHEYWYSRSVGGARLAELQNIPVLRYLSNSIEAAVDDMRHTAVQEGLAVWYLYNMGYIFKTPTACFGIDLCLRSDHGLVNDLDFILTTHEHSDHFTPELLQQMISAGKPAVTRWFPGSELVTTPSEFVFGDVRVRVEIGDHHRTQEGQRDNMLMFQVDCGPAAGNCVIYHCGDNNNYLKMHPDKSVDIFILHIHVGMSVPEAVAHINPQYTFPSHVLELGHSRFPPHAWRWPFATAFSAVESIPPAQAPVFTWGERWLYPGTVLC